MGSSQVKAIGEPHPRTWGDYERGCLLTYGGGHHSDGKLEAFQHGMSTVFNLLRAEFPPAETCAAAPDLLEACEAVVEECEATFVDTAEMAPAWVALERQLKDAILKAKPAAQRTKEGE